MILPLVFIGQETNMEGLVDKYCWEEANLCFSSHLHIVRLAFHRYR